MSKSNWLHKFYKNWFSLMAYCRSLFLLKYKTVNEVMMVTWDSWVISLRHGGSAVFELRCSGNVLRWASVLFQDSSPIPDIMCVGFAFTYDQIVKSEEREMLRYTISVQPFRSRPACELLKLEKLDVSISDH